MILYIEKIGRQFLKNIEGFYKVVSVFLRQKSLKYPFISYHTFGLLRGHYQSKRVNSIKNIHVRIDEEVAS